MAHVTDKGYLTPEEQAELRAAKKAAREATPVAKVIRKTEPVKLSSKKEK